MQGREGQGPHVSRAHKDTKMNSHGIGEGPIENDYIQGPEYCAIPMIVGCGKFDRGNRRGFQMRLKHPTSTLAEAC